MIQPGDYHTHSFLCNHAEGQLSDYIQKAISIGLPEIGLSEHFPMHLLPSQFHKYAMDISKLDLYLDTANQLKQTNNSRIQTRIAFEVDFYKPTFTYYKQALKPYLLDLDYIIGSIHGLKWKDCIIPIDGSFSLPDDLVHDKNGKDALILSYYDDLLDLIKTRYYDVVGHFDVIKKLGFIPQNFDRIWESILQVIDEIETSNLAVEINTSGLRKPENELYPSNLIIQELLERKIPLVFGSDAHRPMDVGYAFQSTIQLLMKNGLKSIYRIVSHEKSQILLM